MISLFLYFWVELKLIEDDSLNFLILLFILFWLIEFWEVRLYTFKESIVLASSNCNKTECETNNTHYSSLIFFSYPNTTDYSKDMIDEMLEKNIILEKCGDNALANGTYRVVFKFYGGTGNSLYLNTYSEIIRITGGITTNKMPLREQKIRNS